MMRYLICKLFGHSRPYRKIEDEDHGTYGDWHCLRCHHWLQKAEE